VQSVELNGKKYDKKTISHQEIIDGGILKFHLFIICFLLAKWNAHIIIFGWCEHILMGISYVNIIVKKLNIKSYVWNSQKAFTSPFVGKVHARFKWATNQKNRLPLIGTACFDYREQILMNRDNIRVSIRITGNITS